jgi:hypothetical protein
MAGFLATAHTWTGGDGPMTLVPLVGLFLTVGLIRLVLRLPIGVPALAISTVLGTLFSTVADTWGLTVAFCAWILSSLLIAGRLQRTRGALGRNAPD